jgi:hypothetical protein
MKRLKVVSWPTDFREMHNGEDIGSSGWQWYVGRKKKGRRSYCSFS